MRVETIGFKEFMSGDYKRRRAMDGLRRIGKVSVTAAGTAVLILPQVVAAAPGSGSIDDTFGNIHGAIMRAFDAGIVLVIIFAGASWALGHRSKAIEIIIGVCCGYILARHAIDIRDALKLV